MTERSTIGTQKVPVSGRTPGSAASVSRHASGNTRRAAVGAEERERMIAIEAYYRAERREFVPGHDLEDWCEAEAEIDRWLGRG